jgi:hypothetical protein
LIRAWGEDAASRSADRCLTRPAETAKAEPIITPYRSAVIPIFRGSVSESGYVRHKPSRPRTGLAFFYFLRRRPINRPRRNPPSGPAWGGNDLIPCCRDPEKEGSWLSRLLFWLPISSRC